MTGAATAAAVAVGMVSLAPTAQGQDNPEPIAFSNARVHRDAGKPLSAKSNETPAARVKAYLKGRGLSDLAVGSLAVDGGAWKSRGVTHLRMEQKVAGLRVHGAFAKAAFDSNGRLVDLVENVAKVPNAAPRAASIDAASALKAAVAQLYPGRAVDTKTTGRSQNTTRFAKSGWYAEPTVEKVALPTTDGGLEVGYVVTTWTADDNELYETVVSGDGKVVDTMLRSANETYNVFPTDPTGAQTRVTDPADLIASPNGWLAGTQTTVNIGGNNARAYLDTNNDNAPDGGGRPATDVFDTAFDAATKPSTDGNREVAVQNLFYLNNLIHDTLYKAGFNEQAGNFQQDNYGKGGRAGDPVAAEAQDGGGTDNANFATPADGQDPRMQMYLWSVPGMYQVNVPSGPAAGNYDAAVGEWAPVTEAGVSGPLALGEDGAGASSTDACEALTGDMTGKVVIVDRGTCTFIIKAKNVQASGAVGMIVANNVEGAAFPMGGTDRKVKIPGLMVSKVDGATLKAALGSTAVLRLDPTSIMRDGDLDTDIVWHEYGHGLTWRMIGRMDGPLAGAIGEGMSDVLSVIVNNDPVVGEYSASDPTGIRNHSYEGYPGTYGDIHGEEVHKDGELYGAIGWDLWKQYKTAGLGQSDILADLVDGMNYTPAKPTYEQMRDGIVQGLTLSGKKDRICMVENAFAKYGVGEGAKGVVRGKQVQITESFKSVCGIDYTPKDPAPTPAP